MKITVPFCHLPNSKVQVFDMDTCKRSEFQVNELLNVSQRDDFAYFVIVRDTGREVIMAPEYDCECSIMWYDKSGSMYSGLLGPTDFIEAAGDDWRKVSQGDTTPTPLDSPVYSCRTN